MSNSNKQVHFWNYVLQVAETLEASPDASTKAVLREQLSTLQEAYSEDLDPVENYEVFVVVKLCAAIERALSVED
jgi:hypothetical protein